MIYTTNCVRNEHLPIDSTWVGTIYTTRGRIASGISVLKDKCTPYEWAIDFAKAVKTLGKKDSSHKYIGGILEYKNNFIVVCTKEKHRKTLESFVTEHLSDS